MRRKQVMVVGNCQASAIANFYRDHVGAPNQEDVLFIDDLGLDTAALQARVQGADTLIIQERDFKHGLGEAELGNGVDVFRFPLILAGFLWPFANEPHVHNVPERPISDGPYPSQMSDSYLNRLIRKGLTPEQALEEYLALDIARYAHLDRMTELYLDRQRERDAATGFAIAGEIEKGFRIERMFLTAEHPDARLFGIVAAQLFAQMAVPADVTANALETLIRSPFPPTELPLHPGVIDHFGLTFATPETRYRFLDEGLFTFAEYVLRYMRYENNPVLRTAVYMAGREAPAITLARIDEGLNVSPASPTGLRVKGAMLDRLGRHQDALPCFRAAIALDPDDPDGHIDLGRSQMLAGAHDEAEAAAERAVTLAPNYAFAHLALAEVRLNRGDAEGTIIPARTAIRLMPGGVHAHRLIGMALLAVGRADEAEPFARGGMILEPRSPDHGNVLAEILEGQGRRDEAIAILEQQRAGGYENDQSYSLLGNFWLRENEIERAEEAFARGAELHGVRRPDLIACRDDARRMLEHAPS